jgi:hypothetical protein
VPNDAAILVFVEKKRPWCVNIKPIAPEAIMAGHRIVRRAVRRFADCLSKGEWPGYDDSGMTAYMPAWRQKQLDTEAELGLLPEPLEMKEAAE